ncbi:MAG: redoxin family protein [Bacteroidetes bacterium]|nr:redoxin family protein [Bacteroidota bacterium]
MKNPILKTGMAVAALAGVYVLYACNQRSEEVVNDEPAQTTAATADNSVAHDGPITLAEFDKTIKGKKLVMVDFYTTWCGPCKRMAPFIARLKTEKADSVIVLSVDAEAQPEISGRYNLEGYPTVICFKNGSVLANIIGYQDYPNLLRVMRQFN